MVLHGRRVPIVGRVCMDLTILDVGNLPGKVSAGDPVTVFGGEEPGTVSADEIAALTGTINYEVVSTVAPRVERVYRNAPAE
jgi:alanine racemase